MATLGRCGCGKVSEFGDLLAGKQVRCMYCGDDLALPPAHACRTCETCTGNFEAALGACPRCAPGEAAAPSAKGPGAAPMTAPVVAPDGSLKCPSCGSPLQPGALMCRWCRKDLRVTKARPAPPPPEPAAPLPPTSSLAPDPSTATTYIAWEDDESLAPVSWWKTWWGAQFEFDKFWSRVPWNTGMMEPLKFYLFGLLQIAISCGGPLILLMLFARAAFERPDMPGMNAGCFAMLLAFGIAGIASVATLFICAGLNHLVAKALGGQGAFEATFRTAAYSSGAQVVGTLVSIPLAFIPIVGPIMGSLAMLGLWVLAQTVGLAHAHRVNKGLAFVAAFAPLLLCCLSYAGLFALAVYSGAGGRP